MTITEAMSDPHLFGSWFDRESWRAWRIFLAAVFGLPISVDDVALYQQHTNRQQPPTAPAKEAWVIVGRRGGKSRIAAVGAVYLACFRDYGGLLAPGEVGTLAVVAADRKQARTIVRYINGFLDGVPMLRELVESRTAESVTLRNRVVVEVHTASWRTLRGYTLVGAVCDEIAFWRSEDAANPDTEIVNGLRPGMATIPGALLLCISSPYARRGQLWEQYRRHFGQDGDAVLVWQGDTASMNPCVDPEVIAEAYAADQASASAEYGALFRTDVETFVSRESIMACVIPDRHEQPPTWSGSYVAFVDPSGGSQDSMTLAVAHQETSGRVILDCCCEVRAPFSPDAVVDQFVEVLRRYRCRTVVGDRYAGAWPRERFQAHDIYYRPSEKVKSDLYRDLLPLLNGQRVELLDHPRLLAQLAGLERRVARGGKDSIDHAPRQHDDVVNAAAGALVLAAGDGRKAMRVVPSTGF